MNKELEIISRAEESLFIMGGLMFPKEPDMLKPALNKSMQKGVNIRMLTAPSCRVDDVEVPTKEILETYP